MPPAPEISELANVAALVRELRWRLGLSQEKFAAKLGVTFSTVSRWERERTMPSPMAFDRMRELLAKMG
jgi:putative transcriptional regulator